MYLVDNFHLSNKFKVWPSTLSDVSSFFWTPFNIVFNELNCFSNHWLLFKENIFLLAVITVVFKEYTVTWLVNQKNWFYFEIGFSLHTGDASNNLNLIWQLMLPNLIFDLQISPTYWHRIYCSIWGPMFLLEWHTLLFWPEMKLTYQSLFCLQQNTTLLSVSCQQATSSKWAILYLSNILMH